MKQLKMARDNSPVEKRALPEGYSYEFFDGSDKAINDWLEIVANGLMGDSRVEAFHACITNYPDAVPEKDLFFVVDPNGRRVATSTSIKHANGEGYVHMVANIPECRGLGIGHAMLSFGISILLERGCEKTVLTTDDFRLAAIKTYLDGGFKPVLWNDDESDMKARWDAVIKELGYTKTVEYIDEE